VVGGDGGADGALSQSGPVDNRFGGISRLWGKESDTERAGVGIRVGEVAGTPSQTLPSVAPLDTRAMGEEHDGDAPWDGNGGDGTGEAARAAEAGTGVDGPDAAADASALGFASPVRAGREPSRWADRADRRLFGDNSTFGDLPELFRFGVSGLDGGCDVFTSCVVMVNLFVACKTSSSSLPLCSSISSSLEPSASLHRGDGFSESRSRCLVPSSRAKSRAPRSSNTSRKAQKHCRPTARTSSRASSRHCRMALSTASTCRSSTWTG